MKYVPFQTVMHTYPIQDQMELSEPLAPDIQGLTTGLKAVFGLHVSSCRQFAILERKANAQASTYPSEIVTCRIGHDRVLQLYCKYGINYGYPTYGHRGGVAYEAAVYRYVLQPSQVTTPVFYGAHESPHDGETWLILEYLHNGSRVSAGGDPALMGLAARWIGQFHATHEGHRSVISRSFLNYYSADYYLGWSRRTLLFADDVSANWPWLESLCMHLEECIPVLLESPPTIIHGEYYLGNVLSNHGIIYPIDWESAAVANGVIDLASLMEGWSEHIRQVCIIEYQRARWPNGTPEHFDRMLDTALLYLHFRWLGDNRHKTLHREQWRFAELHAVAERMGLI